MKGLVAAENGVELRDDLPYCSPIEKGWAVVKVVLAGVCSTDIHIVEGYKDGYKGVLGHEFVGIIHEVNEPENSVGLVDLKVGDRVVGEINIYCGKCTVCENGKSTPQDEKSHKAQWLRRNHCPNRKCLGIVNHDGTFAEYISLPLENLYKVPDNVPDAQAVFAEPIAAACRIWEQGLLGGCEDGTSPLKVAVIGDGKLGLLIAQVACALGSNATVCLFGKHKSKLDIISGNGIEVCCIADDQGLEVATSLNGTFDVAIEACGHPSGLLLAVELLRPLGTVVLKTTCGSSDNIYDMPAKVLNTIVVNELKVVGSRCGPTAKAMELLSQGTLKLKGLVSETFPLVKGREAFEFARSRGVLKVLISMIE